jgi:hypothetical protein
VQGHRFGQDAECLANLLWGEVGALGDLLDRGLAAELLEKLRLNLSDAIEGLDHVDRDANCASLVRDGAGDGLTDPPRRISRELEPALVVELLDCSHEPQVAFLDQVQKGQSRGRVLLSDRNDEPEVRLDEAALRRPPGPDLGLEGDPLTVGELLGLVVLLEGLLAFLDRARQLHLLHVREQGVLPDLAQILPDEILVGGVLSGALVGSRSLAHLVTNLFPSMVGVTALMDAGPNFQPESPSASSRPAGEMSC